MKFVGRADGPHTIICRLFDDDLVADLAEATEFLGRRSGIHLGRGRACRRYPITRRDRRGASGSPVRQGAVHRTELPAARRGGGPSDPGVSRLFRTVDALAGRRRHPGSGALWRARSGLGGGTRRGRQPAVGPGRRAAALGGVFGYAAFNDLSAREHQMHSRLRTLGKNADRSGPISPIVTADEVGDPADGLRLVSRINGEVCRTGTRPT